MHRSSLFGLIFHPRINIVKDNLHEFNMKKLRLLYYVLNTFIYIPIVFKALYESEFTNKYGLTTLFCVTIFAFIPISMFVLFMFKRIIESVYFLIFKFSNEEQITFKDIKRYFYPIIFISVFINFFTTLIGYLLNINRDIFGVIINLFCIIGSIYFCIYSFYIARNIFGNSKKRSFFIGTLPMIFFTIVMFIFFFEV